MRYDADDLLLLGELADRAAMALDNARLYEERDQIAQNLQRGLRPPEPPYVPGLDIAVVFDAFGERHRDRRRRLRRPSHRGRLLDHDRRRHRQGQRRRRRLGRPAPLDARPGPADRRAARAAGAAERDAARGPQPQRLRHRAAAAPAPRRRALDSSPWRPPGHPPAIHVTSGGPVAARRWRRPRCLGGRADTQPRSRAGARRDPGPRHRRLVRGGAGGDAPGEQRPSASSPTPSPTSSWAR